MFQKFQKKNPPSNRFLKKLTIKKYISFKNSTIQKFRFVFARAKNFSSKKLYQKIYTEKSVSISRYQTAKQSIQDKFVYRKQRNADCIDFSAASSIK